MDGREDETLVVLLARDRLLAGRLAEEADLHEERLDAVVRQRELRERLEVVEA